jgi:Tfp pilus assembly protein PilF
MRIPVLAAAAAAACALLLAPPPSAAQATCTAQGFVLDGEGNPLPDVVVSMVYKGAKVQKYKTKTNKKGQFLHVNVYEGPYDITFAKEGIGEVTVKDFVVREIPDLTAAPTFRLGSQQKRTTLAPGAAAPGAALPAPGASSAGAIDTPPAPAGPDPTAIAADLQRAADAFNAGRLDEAASLYESVLAAAPGLALGHQNLGLVYRKKGDLARAEAEFRKAAELKPDFADAHGALSVLLASQGKRDEAMAEAQEAVKDAPQSAQYLFNLGVLQKDTGRSAEAKETFTRLEAIDASNPEIQFHMASVLLAQGQTADAVARLEKYLATAPADAANVPAAKGILAALQKKR